MAIGTSLLGILLISVASLAPTDALASDEPSAYEMVERYNFPKGILPEGAQSYSLKQDGSFEVILSRECEFKLKGGYLVKYTRRITGKADPGHLTELNGVSVKVLLFWFGINEVVRRGPEIDFYVGPLSASFAASNFEEFPQCRCGSERVNAAAADS
ncbi:uncharacterized protein At5g01610-like [Typha latifolia]|uniref:uncharacterized protein At5g01610-like n=1 Tax=Typha latifolia TaxID=4733 RepID=UPI003C2BED9C